MTSSAPVLREHGNAYNIFILVVTVFSLALMAALLLPIPQAVRELLNVYDDVVCLIFLADFLYNLSGSRPRTAYFIHQRGWLDLLGSIPTLGFFQFTALFRLARISRLTRIARIFGGQNRRELVHDVVVNRGQYATFITILAAGIVLSLASILVLEIETASPDANIRTGGDALWWAVVTITTVGYGDRFPVTMLGRLTGVSVMFAGVGIIGALASILASVLVSSPEEREEATAEVAEELEAAVESTRTSSRMAEVVRAGAGALPPVPSESSPPVVPADAILAKLAELQSEVSTLRAELAVRPPGS
jgi:voltage-gated potassium channel